MSGFLSFVVAGHPEPAGSKKTVPAGGRYVVVDANPRSKGWKKVVAATAREAMRQEEWQTLECPVWISMVFTVVRPKGHFKKDGTLSAEGFRWPAPSKKPDLLKLSRGVEDALTDAGVYKDDALIVVEQLRKVWGTEESVTVTVMEWG